MNKQRSSVKTNTDR